jgi:hypothetical protein
MELQNPGRRYLRALLQGLAGLVAMAGLLAALGTWGIMSFYPDDEPNTLFQNAGPLLVYLLPSWACALGLAVAARRLRRR